MKKMISVLVLCFVSTALAANEEHAHQPMKVTPEFESMKGLVGTWEGKTTMNGKEEKLKVTYELTSGGTAIIEKTNPGTPMEMVTVYANNGKSVNATHYCSMGNQPQFKLKQAKGNQFTFVMDGNKGVASKKEMYMSGVTLTLEGNKLKQEWMSNANGKKGEPHVFELTKI